jgi:peptidoglycan/LPS O-acetylase OafA/YrhL
VAREVKGLTGLRGAAASIVAVHHVLQLPISPWHEVRLRGYLAVDIFFVLSGFVMALTYADAFAADLAFPLILRGTRSAVRDARSAAP